MQPERMLGGTRLAESLRISLCGLQKFGSTDLEFSSRSFRLLHDLEGGLPKLQSSILFLVLYILDFFKCIYIYMYICRHAMINHVQMYVYIYMYMYVCIHLHRQI